jgi:hypothetical protein
MMDRQNESCTVSWRADVCVAAVGGHRTCSKQPYEHYRQCVAIKGQHSEGYVGSLDSSYDSCLGIFEVLKYKHHGSKGISEDTTLRKKLK